MPDNPVLEAMHTRRSCRKFSSTPVPDQLIDQVVDTGLWAANGMGYQKPIIIKVTDRALRDKISAVNCKIGGWKPTFDPFYGAPALLIVLAPADWRNRVYDGSLVMGNLMLAAHTLGLGSCWIHRAKEEFELPEFKQMLADLGLEGEWEGIGHCALGYSDGGEAAPKPRKDGRVFQLPVQGR